LGTFLKGVEMNSKRRDDILFECRRRNEIPLTWKNFFIFTVMIFVLMVLFSYALTIFVATEPNAPVPSPAVSPMPIPTEPNAKLTPSQANLGSCFKTTAGKIVRMKVTAYCPCNKCCGLHPTGKTSVGHDAWKTFGVAADPKLLPYKTLLEIPGVGVREVDDTGGAMRQDAKKGVCHIDLRMHSHKEARKFGVKWLNVKVLPRG